MSPTELRTARKALGLTQVQFAHMIGQNQTNVGRMENPKQTNARPISRTTERLVRAYLDGYRPSDWPHGKPAWGLKGVILNDNPAQETPRS